jgi:membrane associated rhomboid family serine protease
VLVLVAVFALQGTFDWRPWAVAPLEAKGLLGLIGGPMLHASVEHIAANSIAILILGTLAGSVYPKATVRALPLLWLGSGLGAWMLGNPGSVHLGASGVTHGLMFLLASLGLLRRDRAAIATGLIGMLFYGGMLMTILPHADVSWQSHMGGAFAGIIAALLFRNADPLPPRQRYSWEDEETRPSRWPTTSWSRRHRSACRCCGSRARPGLRGDPVPPAGRAARLR